MPIEGCAQPRLTRFEETGCLTDLTDASISPKTRMYTAYNRLMVRGARVKGGPPSNYDQLHHTSRDGFSNCSPAL